jgi:hypothetical protein
MPPSNGTQPTNTPVSFEPAGAPQQPSPLPPSVPPTSSKSKWPLFVGITVLVLIAAAAAYFFLLKPDSQSSNNKNGSGTNSQTGAQEATKTTSLTTVDSPNQANGTVSFTHPASWQVTKETDQYGTENTIIKSPLGNAVKMYTRDSVGGSCEDDNDTYTLVKRITTKNSSYVFSEYQAPASWGSQVLRLESSYDKKATAHKALAEGKSNTGVCQNLAGYPIAKDINVTLKNSSGSEATYNDLKDDVEFIAMLQTFNVTDN